MVLAVDLPGIGETSGDAKDPLLGANWKEFYLGYLLGRSMVSLRTEAALAWAEFLTGSLSGAPLSGIHIVGIGEAAIADRKRQRIRRRAIDVRCKTWLSVVVASRPTKGCP